MAMEDKQTHLIERAAARLSAAKSPIIERPLESPVRLPASPDGETNLPYSNGASVQIGEAALMRGGLIDWEQPGNRAAEEFRIIQNELLQQENVGKAGENIVMVTSAFQGEGKSFIALNLSASVARHGRRRVLLVDADYKADALGHLLASSDAPGLLDIASGCRADIGNLTLHTAIENLEFLPVGVRTGRDSELLSSQQMGDLIQDIGRRYSDRLVILDAPPCLMSSAPNTLAAVVGRVVLVVEANTTQEGDVSAAVELLHSCRNLSLVLNKIPTWTGHSFGSYYA
jgi:protein-tyrosine kinase